MIMLVWLRFVNWKKSIAIEGFKFIGNVALVIWKWEWLDEYDDDDKSMDLSTSINVIPETPSPEISDKDSDEEGCAATFEMTQVPHHTVTFKCMGSTKETKYQESLKRVSDLHHSGIEVLCQIKPEPNNPYDSQAIVIKCDVDGSWPIGYIVREALTEVHEALSANKIVKVDINWVKFKVWKNMGWYAGINITCVGQWSSTILRCQSMH